MDVLSVFVERYPILIVVVAGAVLAAITWLLDLRASRAERREIAARARRAADLRRRLADDSGQRTRARRVVEADRRLWDRR
jgi:hypothetical protein